MDELERLARTVAEEMEKRHQAEDQRDAAVAEANRLRATIRRIYQLTKVEQDGP